MTQDIIVYFIVAGAVVYLIRTWRLAASNKKGGCCGSGGCSKAAGAKPNAANPLPSSGLTQITMNTSSVAARAKSPESSHN